MRLRPEHFQLLHRQRAFTLIETLIVMSTLVIIIGSVIMCNLYGLAMADRQQIWMSATDDSAQAISVLTGDIRSAVTLAVGSYASGTFTTNAGTGQQSGNALMVYTTTNTTPSALYYYSTTTSNLTRFYTDAGGNGTSTTVPSDPITNDVTHPIFTAVDYTGTPLTNSTTIYAIQIYLSFIRLQNPQINIETGSVVDLYQVTTTVATRIRL